jgi:ubiquinone/menaquinone biosynthesis C-methylase UbiE
MGTRQHWENIYGTKNATEVSWFQSEARLSLELIQRVAPDRASAILDVGGGASTLLDGLLKAGYRNVTVLDLAAAALEQARSRLGPAAAGASWLEGNVLEVSLPEAGFDVWHDRAVFHFLTDASDRRRYVERARLAVRPGGHVLVATFAEDGPTRCSGLEVARYSPEALHAEFGEGFEILSSTREEHVTPSGATQKFVYCVFRCGHERAERPGS